MKTNSATMKNGGNPYLQARQEWLERYGNYISRAAQWRLVAFITLLIAILSITGNVILINQQKVVPYMVMVDDLGKIMAAGRADIVAGTPQRVIQADIASCIEAWRSVTVDTELQKRMLTRLTAHTAGAAKGMLKQWYEKNNPYLVAKSGKLINVDIKGIPLPVSNNSYRVEWTETVRNYKGFELSRQHYEAITTVEIVPPTTEEVILRNPGGVYITNISSAKIINN